MPIPLIPIISALAAGGSLVPHAAGGMIVTSAAGYVAGTYLTTSAIAVLIAGATTTAGAGLALAFGSVRGIVSATLANVASPAVAATTVGTGTAATTGVIGFLTGPIGLILTTGCAVLGIGYGVYQLYRLKRKASNTAVGEEAYFTKTQAKITQKVILRLG